MFSKKVVRDGMPSKDEEVYFNWKTALLFY